MHERKTHVEYNPDLKKLTRKKRVCAYARVSSEKEEAFHSLSAQISYYQKKIAEHPDWEFVEVFSDRGITGTKENREGFQRMLSACREKKVDIVLAKSITRFARNTVILLETVRELRGLGIDIHFEEEHIETLSEKGEFMISLLAARAQEESRSASENQKWRIQKSYEKGIPLHGNCLGYRLVNHQFLIEEEEESLVKRIFSMYLSGMGMVAIAKKLNEEGFTTVTGGKWCYESVQKILENKKYMGTLILRQQYVIDYVSKKRARNHGERPMYKVEDAHDAIIPKTTFEAVQSVKKERAKKYAPKKPVQKKTFTGIIRCGKCGGQYVRKICTNIPKYAKPVWICRINNIMGKQYCDSQQIPEEILIRITCQALGITSLEGVDLRQYLQKIVVPEKYTLVYVFKDGTEKTLVWKHESRSKSWTPEMKENARQRAIESWKKRKGGDENGS